MEAFDQLKKDFLRFSAATVSASDIQNYRRVVLELVCELIANRHVAQLTDQLLGGPRQLSTHAANVAMLCVVVGLELETYIISQRPQLSADNARDLTAMGIGAMLHDIGKTALPQWVSEYHASDPPLGEDCKEALQQYREHAHRGYMMLRHCRAPAPATQVVLTHHQRWDGKGFPDMTGVTGQRRRGPQRGREIHVFSRVVAVCDALDSLLGHGEQRRPPVAALKALSSSRFAGWFDPIVQDRALRALPPFPMGSHVTLSDGRSAVVVAPSLDQPCRPTLRLLDEQSRLPNGQYPLLDLNEASTDLFIANCAGERVEPHLFTLGERQNWQRQADHAA